MSMSSQQVRLPDSLSRTWTFFPLPVDLVTDLRPVPAGPIDTPLMHAALEAGGTSDEVLDSVPLHRFGEPEEVAGVIAFLLSKEASYITVSFSGSCPRLGERIKRKLMIRLTSRER